MTLAKALREHALSSAVPPSAGISELKVNLSRVFNRDDALVSSNAVGERIHSGNAVD
jgi:hypothetical protein